MSITSGCHIVSSSKLYVCICATRNFLRMGLLLTKHRNLVLVVMVISSSFFFLRSIQTRTAALDQVETPPNAVANEQVAPLRGGPIIEIPEGFFQSWNKLSIDEFWKTVDGFSPTWWTEEIKQEVASVCSLYVCSHSE